MDKENILSQANTIALRRGNISIDVTSTENYNICYV